MKKYLHWHLLNPKHPGYVIWIRYSDERDIEYMQITIDGVRGEFKPLPAADDYNSTEMVHKAVRNDMSGKRAYAWVPATEEEFVLWLLGDTNG